VSVVLAPAGAILGDVDRHPARVGELDALCVVHPGPGCALAAALLTVECATISAQVCDNQAVKSSERSAPVSGSASSSSCCAGPVGVTQGYQEPNQKRTPTCGFWLVVSVGACGIVAFDAHANFFGRRLITLKLLSENSHVFTFFICDLSVWWP
jgi:hypothetical protein